MTLIHTEDAVPNSFANTEPSADLSAGERPRFRWYFKLALLALSAILLSLSFAPFGQFYLAWVALVPWLLGVNDAPSIGRAAWWGWIGACIFFLVNLSYLLLITIPGALMLPLYLGLYWSLAAAGAKGGRLLHVRDARAAKVILNAAAIAAIWVAAEYLRGTLFTGLPWLFLGYSQSPLLALCQISDVTGVYGVMFLVVLVNALVAMTILHAQRKRLMAGWSIVGALMLACMAYGGIRLSQKQVLSPGPKVLVVQPSDRNFRDKGGLEKQKESVAFHLEQTSAALKAGRADLIVWSETTMPALNREVWEELGSSPVGRFSEQVHRGLSGFARANDASLLVGGYYVEYGSIDGKRVATGMRNSAFFYDRSGRQTARYDKLHLVPFGEFIPGKESWPWLYRIFLWLSPYSAEYAVTAGPPDALTVFELGEMRFVAPICFDDVDPALMARMFRADNRTAGKRADFIVNLTNDGWFRWHEQPQHLQHALFRSIENRVPTARAVNTGVSGFIDSCGRVGKTLPVGAVGVATAQLTLDRRYTFYARYGDVFAFACLITSGLIAVNIVRAQWSRRA